VRADVVRRALGTVVAECVQDHQTSRLERALGRGVPRHGDEERRSAVGAPRCQQSQHLPLLRVAQRRQRPPLTHVERMRAIAHDRVAVEPVRVAERAEGGVLGEPLAVAAQLRRRPPQLGLERRDPAWDLARSEAIERGRAERARAGLARIEQPRARHIEARALPAQRLEQGQVVRKAREIRLGAPLAQPGRAEPVAHACQIRPPERHPSQVKRSVLERRVLEAEVLPVLALENEAAVR
jgi:hypothetical protein